ncbi:MAG: response regulator [Sphingobacteriales bacterium]|nr:MAG: response regulator [Sphingobacteriales bacterium]
MKKNLVLYADDDDADLAVFEEALRAHSHYDLKTFHNGLELVTYLRLNRPNDDVCLIVLDINMHVMNGISTLMTIKADPGLSEIPAVLFSTARNPMDLLIASKLSTDILLKPSTQDEMECRIEELLGHISKTA